MPSQAYLKGLYYWNKFLAPEFAKSRDNFQRAIDLDPSYARLALYYGFASGNGLIPPDEGWPKAEADVNKALALDDTLAEVYNPLAAISYTITVIGQPPNACFVAVWN